MITLTEKAKEKIISILDDENASLLRFGLQGGGCNGFTYFFSLEEKIDEGDFEFPLDEGHSLLIDSMSNIYLEEAEIDYRKDLMGESFVFKNPNSVTKCGCGNSVSFG